MRQVFVSYSRNNRDVITQIVHDLQAVGIDTWYDQTLTGGQRWWDSVLSNIRISEVFIFALSPESCDSEACKSELAYAIKLGKPIFPLLVADGINLNLLPHPLNEIQVMDCRRADKEAAFALVKAIHMAPPTPPLPDPLPDAPPVPISYLSTLQDRIDATGPLNAQDQITLIFELQEGIREGRSRTEIRDLLLRMKRRDDLLAKVGVKIDEALKSLEDGASIGPAGSHDNGRSGDPRPVPHPSNCPQCRAAVEVGVRFCGSCGASLAEAAVARVAEPRERAPQPAGAKSRRFMCAPDEVPQLVAKVSGWLDEQGFDCQQMNTEGQRLLLQIRKRGKWRDFVGMATSLNIVFNQSVNTLTVEIGAGKWIDKAAVGTVSMFILWPLAVTAGFGAWEQLKMPEKIFDYVGSRLVSK